MLKLLSPLHHWRIGARLFVAFGAVLALLLVVAVVAVWNLNTLSHTTRHMTQVAWAKADAASRLGLIAALNARRTAEQVFSDPQRRQQLRDEIVASREAFVVSIKRLQELLFLDEGKALLAKIEQARSLGQGFQDQHPGHHRAAWEMAHEIWLVEGHILDGQNALIALELKHTIHQQKRVAVGQLLENCVNIHHRVFLPFMLL